MVEILDRVKSIEDKIDRLPHRVAGEGFDGDVESVLALLIFALGDVALENYRGTALTGSLRKATLSNVRIGIVLPWRLANMDTSSPSTDAFSFLSASGVQQLASQLTQWRGLLPSAIQWDEDDPASFPSVQTLDQQTRNIDPNLTSPASQDPRSALFSTNIDEEPTRYPYAYDIQVAVLRTRFYYAKYMVYRPFVYKVLHFPELVTPEDAQNVAECLRA
ncbi:hypothetical protein SS1G_04631 [Sclerotinia sclerotiorum 1980 UF-70]|uniref:Uncharacterized protein n=1 Tax=Sclerotinia sclerotiorum (strain ATCC 18683 / 1980 / Ss-1) TaxID=665079 RepID=A7EH39_SCLS1|nr:hypothetical protein SS1G_04631 [Sclerotinia sclerotiorum 1980 UF-70]EDO02155.1 hypothetical protein SS1G_04631 [Sclerotinia sclerotiorum 1980 UF-70]